MSDRPTWSEFAFIEELLAPLSAPAALNLKDDAACVAVPNGHDVVISADALVDGVHVPVNADGGLLARRAMACNISDLAAKGAQPYGFTLSLGLAPHCDRPWLQAFADALRDGMARFDIALWGGDTVSAPHSFVALTVHGLVPHGTMIKRSGAQIGDDVYVTGTIGDGWLGLQHMSAAYTDPRPPLAFGKGLRGLASAALDVSDGLLADLDHLCAASHCAMQLKATDIPLSEEGQAHIAQGGALQDLLTGGDDLQIAFTAVPEKADALQALAQQTGTLLHRIGQVTASSSAGYQAVLLDADGQTITFYQRGFRHF